MKRWPKKKIINNTGFTAEHEENRKKVQQMYSDYMSDTYGEPRPMDKTFIYEDMKRAQRTRHRSWATAMVMVVSITVVVPFLVGFDNVYGNNGILHRLYETAMGSLSTDEGIESSSESVIEISDMDDIDEAVAFWKGLYIPEYIPDGYEFDKLTVKKDGVGASADFTYVYGGEKLHISIHMLRSESAIYDSSNNAQWIEMEDRIVRIMESDEGAEVFTEDVFIMIAGNLDREELLSIARNIKHRS